jgi:hypothetical protein
MDRREHPRTPVDLTVLFVTPDMEGIGLKKGSIRNLSSTGCAVQSASQLQVGAECSLFIQVPQQVHTIKVDQARVQWVLNEEFGLIFRSQRPEEMERLRHWLEAMK